MRAAVTFRSVLFACLTVGTFAACGGKSSPANPMPLETSAAGDPSCPVAIPGTSVVAEDTNTGGALVFVTTGDVAGLRARVARVAAEHNDRHGQMAPLPTGDEAGPGGHAGHDMRAMGPGTGAELDLPAGALVTIHSQATTQDVDGGATLAFVAVPADVAALQDQLRQDAEQMNGGTCAIKLAPMAVASDPPEEPAVDPKVALLASEMSAYEQAKPVFGQHCAACHTGKKKANAEALEHFDMSAYPFGGHHQMTIHEEIARVLGIRGGKKPTMPRREPGAVKGDQLALIAAWVEACDAAHAGGAHDSVVKGGHEHHH